MNIDYAENAKKYAREQILMGCSQLESNLYHVDKKSALTKAVMDIRKHLELADYRDKVSEILQEFEQSIALSKKFSLGNCDELAEMALYYMLVNHPKIRSEIYTIEGGDHAFLVIGRAGRSDPHKPEEWGKDAYICDPWSNSVYKASEYLTKTKNYVSHDDMLTLEDGSQVADFRNDIEDFDPDRHRLSPSVNQNSSYLLEASFRSNQLLEKVFLSVNKKYLAAYDTFADNLDKIAELLKQKYGEDDPKFIFITKKISIIRGIKAELQEKLNHNRTIDRYQSFEETQNLIKSKIQSLQHLNEHDPLKIYKNEKSFITMVMHFLKIQPDSARKYNAALKSLNRKLYQSELPSELPHTTIKK